MTDDADILFAVDDGVLHVTLNRPDSGNAITMDQRGGDDGVDRTGERGRLHPLPRPRRDRAVLLHRGRPDRRPARASTEARRSTRAGRRRHPAHDDAQRDQNRERDHRLREADDRRGPGHRRRHRLPPRVRLRPRGRVREREVHRGVRPARPGHRRPGRLAAPPARRPGQRAKELVLLADDVSGAAGGRDRARPRGRSRAEELDKDGRRAGAPARRRPDPGAQREQVAAQPVARRRPQHARGRGGVDRRRAWRTPSTPTRAWRASWNDVRPASAASRPRPSFQPASSTIGASSPASQCPFDPVPSEPCDPSTGRRLRAAPGRRDRRERHRGQPSSGRSGRRCATGWARAAPTSCRCTREARHPRHEGLPASLDVPGDVDVAVVLVRDPLPAVEAVPVPKGVAFTVVFSAGFGELGTDEGDAAEARLAELASGPMRVHRAEHQPQHLRAVAARGCPARSSRSSPSRATRAGRSRRARCSASASSAGRRSATRPTWSGPTSSAYFAARQRWARSPPTSRASRTAGRFMLAADAAARAGVPIVAIKIGRSEEGRAMAQAHTGHLTGSDAVHDAVFEQYGVIRVDDLDEVIEISGHVLPHPPGRRATAVSRVYAMSGGTASHVADLCGMARCAGAAFTAGDGRRARRVRAVVPRAGQPARLRRRDHRAAREPHACSS